MTQTLRTAAGAALVALCLGEVGGASVPRFFDDDPIWVEPVTQDVTTATRYEPDLVYESLENLFAHPGDHQLGQRALNINTVDEVPDGPYFTNRAGRVPLTPAIVARAANTTDGPASGPWTIVSAKSDGVTPGFTIRDSVNALWFLKFDPPGHRGMATGAEIVAAKLFWALGYHTAEYHIARLVPASLVIGGETRVTPPGEAPRRMRPADIAWLLSRADRDADGSYRVIASRAAPGRPVGRLRFYGTRADDPNDLVPHEHHRELRGYFVFAAWLNHVDAKSINSLSALVTENGRTFIRHYLLDFGSTLGSAAVGPREAWEGFEFLVEDKADIGLGVAALGFRVPAWRTLRFFESPTIGRLPLDHTTWNPRAWSPHITNAAFRHLRPDDGFWAARKVGAISDAMIAAAVAEGRFDDPPSEQFLIKAIIDRRQRILATYLPGVNPVVDPSLDTDGRLAFRNAAVDAHVALRPQGYRARWFSYDNTTDTASPLGDTSGAESPLPTPALPAGGFVKVEVSADGGPAAWSTPVTVYFRKRPAGWETVGIERLP